MLTGVTIAPGSVQLRVTMATLLTAILAAPMGCTEQGENVPDARKKKGGTVPGNADGTPTTVDRRDHVAKLLALSGSGHKSTGEEVRKYLRGLTAEEAWRTARAWALHQDENLPGKDRTGVFHSLWVIIHRGSIRARSEAIRESSIDRAIRELPDQEACLTWRVFLIDVLVSHWDSETPALGQSLRILDSLIAIAGSADEKPGVRNSTLNRLGILLTNTLQDARRSADREPTSQQALASVRGRISRLDTVVHDLLTQPDVPRGLLVPALKLSLAIRDLSEPPKEVDLGVLRSLLNSYERFPEFQWVDLLRSSLLFLDKSEVQPVYDAMCRNATDNREKKRLEHTWKFPHISLDD
jgi:hypothetical protein